MKILHTVEFYSPSVGGAQEVVRQISERLAAKGHDVTVATTKLPERKSKFINGVKIVEFDISGNAVNGYKGNTDQYKNFLLKSDFDVVMNYAAQQWATDLFFEVIDQVKAKKIFVPCGFSGLYNPAYRKYFQNMPHVLRKYNASVYLSNDYRDINFSKNHRIKNTYLITNGAGEDEFLVEQKINLRDRLNIPADNFLILSVGSHTGVKGHTEAIKTFKKAAIDNATLLIVGNQLNGGCYKSCLRTAKVSNLLFNLAKKNKRIIVTELKRPETVSAYKAADLFLFPSNIEASPIVLFECMAAKTPFLVADVGNSIEIVSWTKAGEILPTNKDKEGFSHVNIIKSSKMLEHLYNSPLKRKQLADRGFKIWKKKFSWEKIADSYLKLYRSV